MSWQPYLPGLRRFKHHSAVEVLLRWGLPDDWDDLICLADTEHEVFDLADSSLYAPGRNRPHQQGSLRGFIIDDGILWPAMGAIRTSTGGLVAESFFDQNRRDLALEWGYAKRFLSIEDRGAVATLGSLYRNYYHRFADSIPRIYSLYHPVLQRYDRIGLYVDVRFSEDEMKVIRHLIPKNVELEVVSAATRIRAAQCIHLPYLSSDRTGYSKFFDASAGFLPTECLEWLREETYSLFGLDPEEPFRRLYVTRRNAKVRRLLNEKEVASFLTGRGFEVVALEDRPLCEQVRLFAEASIVVAQHGAGLVNLLFAQAPRVLEVCSDQDRQIFFRLISEARGFPHVQIHRDGADKNADVRLPIAELKNGLARLERESQDFLHSGS